MLGLSLVLYPNTRQYGSVVMNGFKGFKALIHSAKDFPEVGGKGFAIGSGKEVFVGIGAQYTTASEEVENMSFERRKCLKQGEGVDGLIIESFSYYDQKACLMECSSRHIRDQCGCLPYYFPEFEQAWNISTTCNLPGEYTGILFVCSNKITTIHTLLFNYNNCMPSLFRFTMFSKYFKNS